MLIYAEVDGITVPIQRCIRNGKEYYRLAPNFWKPSEDQKAVRDNLAYAAWKQKEKDGVTTRENVDSSVQKEFQGWIPSQRTRPSKLQERVKEIKKLSIGVKYAEVNKAEVR